MKRKKVVHYARKELEFEISPCGYACVETTRVWSRVTCKVCLRARGKKR